MPTLMMNVDHVAALRQVRGDREPDPVQAGVLAELAGARAISAHLREDRRHVQDRDVYLLKQTVTTRLNLVVAPTKEMVQIALDVVPQMVTFVPERAEDRTNEAGVVVRGNERELARTVESLHEHNIQVCILIDPDPHQLTSVARTGAVEVELHTGAYANAAGKAREEELARLRDVAFAANHKGLTVRLGHGLDYFSAAAIADMERVSEVHIGHAIVARAMLVGMDTAVRDMISVI